MDFRFTNTLYYEGWDDDMREVYGWPHDEDPVDEDDPANDYDEYDYQDYLDYEEYLTNYVYWN